MRARALAELPTLTRLRAPRRSFAGTCRRPHRSAMRHLFADTHNLAEGAGAAALAALAQDPQRQKGAGVATIQTGGNIDKDLFAQTLSA
jgi:hypothetical protein